MEDTIYLSKLKIIQPQKKESGIANEFESKINLNAKYDDKTDRIAVNNTVRPILAYLFISKRGHLLIRSNVVPEQKSKILVKNDIPTFICL